MDPTQPDAPLSQATPDSHARTLAAGEAYEQGVAGALVGTVLGGRYELVDFLGAGGMGEVYRARDRELDEIVALKVLRSEVSDRHSHAMDRFRNEVRLARRVTHHCVARTFEFGEADGVRFLTMEFVEGESLARLLSRHGKLGADEILNVAVDVCDALGAAHAAGIVHRDIKPDNVLVTRSGRCVVTDFGVAELASRFTNGRDMSGTPAYMAPEQVRGEAPTASSDLYALGVTLFELASGELPFNGTSALSVMVQRLAGPPPDVRERVPELPRQMEAIIRCAMALEPKDRFASAAEMRAALQAASSAGRRSMSPWAPDVITHDVSVPWVIVEVAPIAYVPECLAHLGSALHAELILALGRVPLVRVATSAEEGEEGREVCGQVKVTSHVVDGNDGTNRVAVNVATAGEQLWFGKFQLSAAHIAPIANAAAAGLGLALDATREDLAGVRETSGMDVLDICLRARHHFGSSLESELAKARSMYEDAIRRAPNEPRVLSGYAMVLTRFAFFVRPELGGGPGTLALAQDACNAALRGAPSRPEPSLAAGYLALHTNDPVVAAMRFREALALAPSWPESHEWLGRMLIEAGYVKEGRARLLQAIRLDPALANLRWEIARAHALDGEWAEHDRLMARYPGLDRGRWLGRLRVMGWRGDRAQIEQLGAQIRGCPPDAIFDPMVCNAVLDLFLEGRAAWPRHVDLVLGRAFTETFASVRRTIFYAQVACEIAAYCGETELAAKLLLRSTERGLFDLHWLEKSPFLGELRVHASYAGAHAIVADRAHRIFDALYRG